MKILYKDLVKFLLHKPSINELSEKLFQLGHEHEIEGSIFNMEFTPNRGDCLSLYGLARDLNIFFGNSLDLEIYEDVIDKLDFDFINLSPEACSKVSFLEIELEGKISEYKPYLENFFSELGHKKINFFTDISNYISYELGQPTHCFDRDKIEHQLIFEDKTCNQVFKTLHGSEITLDGKNCVFSINNEIISLAGVMGGATTACSKNTKKTLIECAYFNPELIIGKSVKYNLTSDAAYKFERGVDISSQDKTLRRFIKIVKDHARIKSLKMRIFDYSSDNSKNFIPLDHKKINKILGIKIDLDCYIKYLQKLDFKVSGKTIEVPPHRHDINHQNDLAEEVARVIGYNNIESKPVKPIFSTFKDEETIKILEDILVHKGFSEVINYPFSDNKDNLSISIDNPIDTNKNNLRTNLKESLIQNLIYNERRQHDSIKLFEISDLYLKKNLAIVQEKKIGLIISGRQGHNYEEFSKKLDLKYLKNALGDLEDCFTFQEVSRNSLDTKKNEKIFYAEALIDDIKLKHKFNRSFKKSKTNFIKYKSISQFPSSLRDFSFSITNLSKVAIVINYFENISDDIVKDVFAFDFYKNINENSIKIGYRIIFQSHLKTLSDADINQKVKEIIDPILKIDGVSIPGM